MRTRFLGLVVAAAAAALLPASAMAAPPEKQATLNTATPNYAWNYGPATGAVYTSTVANRVGCNAIVFNCDFVLLKTTQVGTLNLAITTADKDTLKDIDLHLYMSDASGTQGDLWSESVTEFADETLVEPGLPVGYWLVRVDYYLGAGSYSGTAGFTL